MPPQGRNARGLRVDLARHHERDQAFHAVVTAVGPPLMVQLPGSTTSVAAYRDSNYSPTLGDVVYFMRYRLTSLIVMGKEVAP